MKAPIQMTGGDLFARSFLAWSAQERVGAVCAILVALWMMVAWAVALP